MLRGILSFRHKIGQEGTASPLCTTQATRVATEGCGRRLGLPGHDHD